MIEYETMFHKEIDEFVDRTEITKLIMDIIEHKIQRQNFFKVLSIYGMGGIGKSSLINEIETKIKNLTLKNKIIKVSFEINNSSLFIENLVKIALSYDHSCIIFNYALLKYHSYYDIYQLDVKIVKQIQSTFLTDLTDTVLQLTNYALNLKKINIPTLEVPSISDILDIVGTIYNKSRNLPFKKTFEEIDKLDLQELLFNLPIYLAIDISRNEKEKDRNLIFIFDSYNPSKPYSESLEWLARFIGKMQSGLFIITSREKLLWEDSERDIHPYELKSYPEEETIKYLSKYISDKDIINTIIKYTECVPIYVDLALNVYKKELEHNNPNIINKAIFKDREALTVKFINHLDNKYQDVIFNLATIRVFNKDIFEHIVRTQNLQCSVNDYDEIINVSLMQYVEIEKSVSLVKLHEVFCKNAIKVLNRNQVFNNLNCYLDYIIKRESYKNANSISVILTLLVNVINIENDFDNSWQVPTCIIEKTLDLFFMIFETGIDYQPIIPRENCNIAVRDMIYFIHAVQEKKNGTKISQEYLDKIFNIKHLGYHKKSYEIFKLYVLSLTGNYEQLAKGLITLNNTLNKSDQFHWYYKQIKLYSADLEMMLGKFWDSFTTLDELKQLTDETIFSFYNFLQIQRTIGHIYRFNYLFEDAFKEYAQVLEHNECGLPTKSYIYTNLIETACYYDTEYVNKNFDIAIDFVKKDGNIKNEAKLYYAKAISNLLEADYEEAKYNIKKSIRLNMEDGYKSGILFAYIAQAYLDYALYDDITPETLEKIKSLLENNKVYLFFRLTIAIMKKDDKLINTLEQEYQWLDFNYTKQACKDFLRKLVNH